MTQPRNQREAIYSIVSMINFKVGNIFGERLVTIQDNAYGYAVYSYGKHWVILYYSNREDKFYVNTDKVSVSTTRQTSIIKGGLNTLLYKYIAVSQDEINNLIQNDYLLAR